VPKIGADIFFDAVVDAAVAGEGRQCRGKLGCRPSSSRSPCPRSRR
jgi:hypothetical protein